VFDMPIKSLSSYHRDKMDHRVHNCHPNRHNQQANTSIQRPLPSIVAYGGYGASISIRSFMHYYLLFSFLFPEPSKHQDKFLKILLRSTTAMQNFHEWDLNDIRRGEFRERTGNPPNLTIDVPLALRDIYGAYGSGYSLAGARTGNFPRKRNIHPKRPNP
jgi:hypothetical protein